MARLDQPPLGLSLVLMDLILHILTQERELGNPLQRSSLSKGVTPSFGTVLHMYLALVVMLMSQHQNYVC